MIIAELRKKDVGESHISEFLSGVQKCVVSTLKKLFERYAVRSVFLRNAVIFDPAVLISSTCSALSSMLKNMQDKLSSKKRKEDHIS